MLNLSGINTRSDSKVDKFREKKASSPITPKYLSPQLVWGNSKVSSNSICKLAQIVHLAKPVQQIDRGNISKVQNYRPRTHEGRVYADLWAWSDKRIS
jgi:hypothetical protein